MTPDQPSVDGVTSAPATPVVPVKVPGVAGARRVIVLLLSMLYIGYLLWCGALLSLLPPADGGMVTFVKFGMFSMMIGGAFFLFLTAIGFLRIRKNAELPPEAKKRALIRTILYAVPGILLSAFTAVTINGEPPITLEVTKPTQAELIAPVAVTFSVEKAVQILQTRGYRAISYNWDVDGDSKVDRQTVIPQLTTTYQREGSFTTSVTITFSGASPRKLSRRIIIQKAVFTVDPLPAIVGVPVSFDVANLVENRTDIQAIAWDFDNDGKIDLEGESTTAATTFYKTGTYPVGVTVKLTNATESQYSRAIEVIEPPPLPFPVEVVTEPKNLKSPPPFVVVFSVKTAEPLAQVQWVFGDGTRAEGQRVAHTFDRRGTFGVVTKVRSGTGTVATLVTTVKIAEPLSLVDLNFKGSPQPVGDTISGEIPLTISLDPQTSAQFVTFVWEAPDATEIGSTDGALQAIYRKPGTYKLTLIGEDAEEKVLRKQFKVEAKPVSPLTSFQLQPEEGIAPLTVDFDASESDIPGQSISGFEWDFGDGSQKQFGGAQTQHVYEIPGTYQVSLRVRTTSGTSEQTATRTILVRAPSMEACILASRVKGPAPLYVSFNSECTTGTPTKFEWNFKDGGQSIERNPVYKFEKSGVYSVELLVTDASGRTSKKSVTITVE